MTVTNPTDLPDIFVGSVYVFHAEMQQEYLPPEERMRRFTGQEVAVVAEEHTPRTDTGWTDEDSTLYRVRAGDGTEFTACEEELNGWDFELGQFFHEDGTYGHERDPMFLINERS